MRSFTPFFLTLLMSIVAAAFIVFICSVRLT